MCALSHVAEHAEAIERLGSQREREVARALYHGATWCEIGDALGVTTQSAHRKYRWLTYDPQSRQAWTAKPLPLG